MPYIGTKAKTFNTFTSSDVKVTDDLTVTDDASVGGNLNITGNVDVDGILETDNLTINGAQGTDGQVLTSTGSGVGWEAAGGGLTLIQTATISNTTTGDFTMASCLSSTYQNYFLITDGAGLTTGDEKIEIKAVDSSGTLSSTYAGGFADESHSGFTTFTDALMKVRLNVPESGKGGGNFAIWLNMNVNAATRLSGLGHYSTNSDAFLTQGSLTNSYTGTPTGLNFAVDSGSKKFANGMKVRIYGLKAS
tara:strand:- start:536 stop:1282 length:747 start_codon:yes stop_codon:yes gene_type:complete